MQQYQYDGPVMRFDDCVQHRWKATTPASGNNYNFTQNNYSPKALSRIDIYRQTKNQFSALKGLVET